MDIFSAESAKELFLAFPLWKELARTEDSDDGSTFLVIEVPAPAEADVEHGLVIDTSNGEVTVGFDCYHSHFDSFVGDDDDFGTNGALEFIEQIIAERVAVISWWHDEVWRGSGLLELGDVPVVPSWATASDFNRIRVRSWRGVSNYDGGA